MAIDKTAIIDPKAELGKNVTVGPYAIIGPKVIIGDDTEIGAHANIIGRTKIGKHNKIWQFAVLGNDPQHIGYKGEDTLLEIGDHNVIREFCSFHRGTEEGGGVTKIGDHNFFMAYVHVAHDCSVGSHTVFANNATLAGHVKVGDYANFGGLSAVVQFCKVGAYAFVAGTTGVIKDVLPYIMVSSTHGIAKPYGVNLVGLTRHGFAKQTIKSLRQAYNIIFKEGLTVKDAIPRLEAMLSTCPEVQLLVDALQGSTRGIIR